MIHIYHEVGRFQAILALFAVDRMGLIYELSRALFEREFDITRGRAVTRQGAVSVDGEKVTDENLALNGNQEYLIKVGKKRFLKITT